MQCLCEAVPQQVPDVLPFPGALLLCRTREAVVHSSSTDECCLSWLQRELKCLVLGAARPCALQGKAPQCPSEAGRNVLGAQGGMVSWL